MTYSRAECIQSKKIGHGFILDRALKARYGDDALEVVAAVSRRHPRFIDDDFSIGIAGEPVIYGQVGVVHGHRFLRLTRLVGEVSQNNRFGLGGIALVEQLLCGSGYALQAATIRGDYRQGQRDVRVDDLAVLQLIERSKNVLSHAINEPLRVSVASFVVDLERRILWRQNRWRLSHLAPDIDPADQLVVGDGILEPGREDDEWMH